MPRIWPGSIRLLPASATPDARILLATRALRGFADGAVSVLLAAYLSALGFSPVQIGAIATGTMLGSAALTLAVGLLGQSVRRRVLLLGAAGLMLATGLGFIGLTAFWPLLVVAIAGTLNASNGDVSVFLPLEQAVVSETVAGRDRTALFARYNLAGTLAGACGALVSGIPALLARHEGWSIAPALRSGFVLYACIAVLTGLLYSRLSPAIEAHHGGGRGALVESRTIVLRLAAVFSLDALGGGFAVQSILVLWLFLRFHLSTAEAGTVFFAAGVLAATSQLISSWLAGRIGLINTMVWTHAPSNLLLIGAALAPNAPLAITLLLMRMSLSQMDVPARQSYVMAMVPAHERAAAASVTNVPRSLAAGVAPLLAGLMLQHSSFGWPLIAGGTAKLGYDFLLLQQFRSLKPPDEATA